MNVVLLSTALVSVFICVGAETEEDDDWLIIVWCCDGGRVGGGGGGGGGGGAADGRGYKNGWET